MARFKTSLKTLLAASTFAIASLGLYAQTASAQTAAPAAPRVDQREANQQQRITQGVASGELTQKETYKLEKEQAAINKTEARAKADGKVTRAERKRLHKMQDAASPDIQKQKHDAQTARP